MVQMIWHSLLFLFTCYSIANIVVFSHICKPLRELMALIDKFIIKKEFLSKLINCIVCFGFWSGVLASLVFDFQLKLNSFSVFSTIIPIASHPIWLLFFNGCVASGFCWTMYMLLEGRNEKYLSVTLNNKEDNGKTIL